MDTEQMIARREASICRNSIQKAMTAIEFSRDCDGDAQQAIVNGGLISGAWTVDLHFRDGDIYEACEIRSWRRGEITVVTDEWGPEKFPAEMVAKLVVL